MQTEVSGVRPGVSRTLRSGRNLPHIPPTACAPGTEHVCLCVYRCVSHLCLRVSVFLCMSLRVYMYVCLCVYMCVCLYVSLCVSI